jgi:glycine cleavage system H protein
MRPTDRSYLDSHEWAKIDGDIVTVGITDFAIEQLGELVFLELPENGQTVSKGVAFGEVESVKAVSDLISPVSGEIIEVHTTPFAKS